MTQAAPAQRDGQYRLADDTVSFTSHALGGQLTSFQLADDQLLYLSPLATFEPGTSIRGGVPVCFPWFADGPNRNLSPMHGFVQTVNWELVADEPLTSAGEVSGHQLAWQVGPAQVANQPGRDIWPADFQATCRQTFDGPTVTIELLVENPGDTRITFEESFHAYLRVDDISQVVISGLDGSDYLDKTRDYAPRRQSGDVTITEFTDRIYTSNSDLILRDGAREIQIDKINSANTVVWNPFPDKIGDFADLPNDAWHKFVCVEAGNVDDHAIVLEPGQTHDFGVRFRRVT